MVCKYIVHQDSGDNVFRDFLPGETYHNDKILRKLAEKLIVLLERKLGKLEVILEVGPGTNRSIEEVCKKRGIYYISVDNPWDSPKVEEDSNSLKITGDICDVIDPNSDLSKILEEKLRGKLSIVIFWASGVYAGGSRNWSVYFSIFKKLCQEGLIKGNNRDFKEERKLIFGMALKLYNAFKRIGVGAIVETHLGYARHFTGTYWSPNNDMSGNDLLEWLDYLKKSCIVKRIEVYRKSREEVYRLLKNSEGLLIKELLEMCKKYNMKELQQYIQQCLQNGGVVWSTVIGVKCIPKEEVSPITDFAIIYF